MSRKIFKNRETVSTENFQFQPSEAERVAANTLEAEAELDAFQSDIFQSPPPSSGPGPGAGLAEKDAKAIIVRAQADADALIAAARANAAEIEQEAYEKGLSEGRKTGEIVADQELQAVLTLYHNSIEKLDKVRDLLVDQLQLDIMELVIHTSEKLVKTELKTHPQTILHMIRDAVRSLKERKHMVLYLSQDDHEFVMNLGEAEKQNWLGTQIQVESDPSLLQGSLRIETSAGELDALISTQIQQIRDELKQV